MNELRTTLDMGKETYVSLKCKQNDDRTLILTLLSNGVTWIPEVGSILELRGKRSDSTVTIQTTKGITIVNNVVTIELSKDFTRVQGTVELELNIRKLTEITTFTFTLVIEPSVIQSGAMVSKNTSSLLEELTNITDWGHMHLNNAINNVVTLTKKHGQYSVGLASGTTVVLPTVEEGEYVDIDYMFYADSDLVLVFEDENIWFSNEPIIQAGRSYRFSFRYVEGTWYCEWVKLERYLKDYIYKAGDTCDVLTGGYNFEKVGVAIATNSNGTIMLQSMGNPGGLWASATTINSIDFTNYSKLHIDFSSQGSSDRGFERIFYLGSTTIYSIPYNITKDRQTITIDVSNFIGKYPVKVGIGGQLNGTPPIYIYNAWLEKNESVDKVTGKSLILDTEITRLTGISTGANKVLDSTINGNILIDNVYYTQSGTTTQRPIPTLIGQAYFDTTLGKPIWCKTVTTPVWVDSTGTVV